MTEHEHAIPSSDGQRPPLDTNAIHPHLDHLVQHQAQFEFICSGTFLTTVNSWLDRTGEMTISADRIHSVRLESLDEFEVASHMKRFVSLVTDFADTAYRAEATQGDELDDGNHTRWANFRHEGTTYEAGYEAGPWMKTWITRLTEPLPEGTEVLELETIFRGSQTERAEAIDAKLARLATFAAGLLEEGVPASVLSLKLACLSEEIAEQ